MIEPHNLPVPIIDTIRCTGCGLCVRVCPNNALVMKDGVAGVGSPNACDYTGYCESICPVQAINRPFQIIFITHGEQRMKPTFYPNWQEKVIFGDDGPQPQVLMANEKIKVVLAGLKPGQKIPPHSESLATYHILKGSGTMIVDNERYAVTAGATIITPDGAARGMEADTELVFLGVRVS